LPTPIAPKTITNNDVIYLIMPDRFSDGDPTNNVNVDKSNPRAWHGGDFLGIINHLDYLKELGITAIWLTPWYQNDDEILTCDKPWCPMASYHGYGATDYYGVENHFGTMADLQELVKKANENGIKVIQDQVANHFGYRHEWVKNPPLENWFPPYEQNTFNNSVLLSPNGSPAERNNLLTAWFDPTLPDLNQNEPEVAKYLIQNALWWVGTTGISGIRQDTIQYMERKFIREWSLAVLKQYPNFYLVGEIKKEDAAHTAFFQGGKTGWDGVDTKLPSVFDFKLWETTQEVFTGKKPMRALRDVLTYDGLYGDINRVTTLTDNHDTPRFMGLKGATKEGAKLSLAFVLATRGIPQMYYGDEVLMAGGDDPFNRNDFTKFDKSSRTADEQEMLEWVQKWIALRKKNIAIRDGKTIDLFYDGDVFVFERQKVVGDFGETKQIVFGFNNSEKPKKVEINAAMNQRLSVCFGNLVGLENVYEQIEFEKTVRKFAPSFPKKCFETKLAKFKLLIPAKSVVAFEIFSVL
jgi:neopullulanase